MATPAFRHRHRHATSGRARFVWLGLVAALLVGGLAVLIHGIAFNGGTQNPRPGPQRVLDGLVTGPGRIAPGATAYVAGPHGVWAGSAGIATIGTPMTLDARLRLNSMGKTWTATLIMKLVGEGRLKLDDTVSRWLPGLLPYGSRITVKQLLNMTSGMIDTNDFYARPAYYINRIKDPALRARVLAAAHGVSRSPQHRVTCARSRRDLHATDEARHYTSDLRPATTERSWDDRSACARSPLGRGRAAARV